MSTGVGGITIRHIRVVIVTAMKGPQKLPLGRWAICKNKNTNLVVDYSNEDHCGPCGTYIKTVTENKYKQDVYKEILDMDEEVLDMEFQAMMANTYTPENMKNN